jgi:ribA/ribD-fused uncharacterized protein
MAIYFFSKTAGYAWLSNFSPHGFRLDKHHWPSVEHWFQAQKFVGTTHEDWVRESTSPKEAKRRGRSRTVPIRADWEAVKEDVMRRGVLAKFETHADIRALLLATGDEELIENAPGDYYWGVGRTGTGANRLGVILTEIRALLLSRASTEATHG